MPATRVVTRLQDQDDVSFASLARGALLYRGATNWNNLPAGATGLPLLSGGPGADPAWGQLAHGSLSGLATGDPHTQYATLSPGSSGRNLVKAGGLFPAITLEPQGDASQLIGKIHSTTPQGRDFNVGYQSVANVGSARANVVYTWGYNGDASGGGFDDPTEPSLCYRIESIFAPSVGNEFIEVHIQYNTPGGFGCRPMGYTIDRNTNNIAQAHQVHSFELVNPSTSTTYLVSTPTTFLTPVGHSVSTNNVPALQQRNAAGTQFVPLFTLDSLDRILFGTGTNPCVVQQNLTVGGTLAAAGNASFGASAGTDRALNVRGPSTPNVFVTAANFEAGTNSDPGGTAIELGANTVNFGGKIYGGRWSSGDRGMRLAGVNNAGAENAEVRINAETPNVSLVTSNIVRLQVDNFGNVAIGTGAVLPNSANGFLNIVSMAGAPTSTPTAFTGRVPLTYDTANNRLYIYNGAWRSVALA